ncbi:MAG: exosome complex RNA-binding protein Rrp4 [Candidatus Aenigmatarchaeota archaeon]
MNGNLEVENNQIVVPGDLLGKNISSGKGTYKVNDEVRSKHLGVTRIKGDDLATVVKLAGTYIPQEGDGIIGSISDVKISSWIVDIDSPYEGFLSISDGVDEYVDLEEDDITDYFDMGDVIYTKIKSMSKSKDVKLTMKERMCRKLKGGSIIKVTPTKVPRVIGRGGSMIELIKELTGCHIIVGQNGLVWCQGDRTDLVDKALSIIENKSHTEGLTDRIREMLEKETGKSGDNDE